MQVSVENTGELERRVEVQIPEENIHSQVQSKLQSMTQTTRVQGFRPGKVPFKVIQGRYGSQVRQEVIGQLVQSSFQEAVTQEKLRPVGSPTIDPLEDTAGEGLKYTATFEVMPEITLQPIEKLNIERPGYSLSSDDIDATIERMQKQHTEYVEVERAAKEDDQVTIDFQGKIDGEIFEGGSAEDYSLVIGAKRFIEGFEEGLIGAKAGSEVELELTFPEEYQAEHLAGKDVVFMVTLKGVKEPKTAELNEEFFQRYGLQEGGIDAFKDLVKGNLERELNNKINEITRDNMLDVLFEEHTLTLPKLLVDNEAQRLLDEMKQRFQQQGMPVEAFDKTNPEDYREQAEKRVTLQLLLSEIIKQNELKADPAKVKQLIEQQAQGYEDPQAVINWYYSDQQRLADIEAVVLEQDIVQWVADKAQIKEKKMTFDEIMNYRQTG